MKCVCVFSRLALAGLAAALLAVTLRETASAQLIGNQRFQVRGLVIVWAADANGNAPIVSDFIVDTGTGNSGATSGDLDLIGTDVHTVVTGSLDPVFARDRNGAPIRLQNIPGGGINTDRQPDGVLDAADTFDAFRIRANSDLNTRRGEIFSSFYVASNTAFSIDAQATPLGTTTPDAFDRIRLKFRVTESGNDGLAFGSAAQFPHTNNTPAAGTRSNNRRLTDFVTPRRIFQGNRRTARANGSIAQQSVRFDSRYRYNSGQYDLSDGVIDAEAEVAYTVYIP